MRKSNDLLEAIEIAQQSPESECPDNRYNVLDNQQKTLLRKLTAEGQSPGRRTGHIKRHAQFKKRTRETDTKSGATSGNSQMRKNLNIHNLN